MVSATLANFRLFRAAETLNFLNFRERTKPGNSTGSAAYDASPSCGPLAARSLASSAAYWSASALCASRAASLLASAARCRSSFIRRSRYSKSTPSLPTNTSGSARGLSAGPVLERQSGTRCSTPTITSVMIILHLLDLRLFSPGLSSERTRVPWETVPEQFFGA